MILTLLKNESEPGTGTLRLRGRELETGRLVLRAATGMVAREAAAPFLTRRAAAAVSQLERSPARAALRGVVEELEVGDGVAAPAEVARRVSRYGGVLERHRLWPEALHAYEHALDLDGECAELMLHAARLRRLTGNRSGALELYGRVRRRCGQSRLGWFAEIGEALVSSMPIEALTAVLERAVAAGAAGAGEAAAVALEERGRLHRSRGSVSEAVEDYAAAALRYPGAEDRVRVAHDLADLLLARGDASGAREALCAALDLAAAAQRPHTVHRLRVVARIQNDTLGLRRWASVRPGPLVSLSPALRGVQKAGTFAPRLRVWRDALVASGPAGISA